MNTTIQFNVEYFKTRFAKHDASFKEIIEEHVIPKSSPSSRKKRDYKEAFLPIQPTQKTILKTHHEHV